MINRKPKVFVSMAFTGKSWEQVTKEREDIHVLAQSFDLEVVEQFIGYQGKEDFENKDYNPSFILAKDKNFIKEADAFVVDLSEPSMGADCELAIAKELFDKKVYAIVPDQKRKNHPWVRFYCDFIFDTMEEAFRKVKSDFSGKPHYQRIDRRQYDPIATEYRLVEETPAQKFIYDPAVINFLQQHAKDGSIIVLHGGSGYRARLAKKAGVSKVACIDISYKQTQIGKMEELRDPVGIDFFILDPYSRDFLSSLPPEMIGSADVVLGAFLLDHAMTSDELEIVSKNISQLLTKDGIFFGLSDHPKACVPTDPKYGVAISFEDDVNRDVDGVPRRISIHQTVLNAQMEVLHFHNFMWKQETVLKALSQAGFSSVEFTIPKVSQEGIEKFKADFWNSYNDCPMTIEITAKR